MASPNATYDELVTTTLRNRSGTIADNVSNNNALLRELEKKGNKVMEDGGTVLVEELDYQENSTFKYYSGYETLDVSPSDVLSAAEYDWKNAAGAVTIDGPTMRKNSGKSQVINLISARIKNLERTFMNNISTGVYSDGTGDAGKQIGGLQLLVADDPTTGTVGGIDRSAFTFWRNVSYDATTDGGAAATAANIQSYMESVWLQLVRGADNPEMIVADSNYFKLYWDSLQAIQRITDTTKGASGFQSLEFNGPGGSAPVILDQAAPTNHMYFLNMDYLFWKVHKDADFKLEESIKSLNQDAIVRHMLWMGNLTMSNASLQGVLKD